jgi:cytochrome c oxidase assembly factor CtaG
MCHACMGMHDVAKNMSDPNVASFLHSFVFSALYVHALLPLR